MHTYTHTYVRTSIHTSIHTYLHTYVHTYIRTYIHIHTCMHAYIHTCIHTYIHTSIHTYVRTSGILISYQEYRNSCRVSGISFSETVCPERHAETVHSGFVCRLLAVTSGSSHLPPAPSRHKLPPTEVSPQVARRHWTLRFNYVI